MKKALFTLAIVVSGLFLSAQTDTEETHSSLVSINHKSRDFVEVKLKKESTDVVRVNIYGKTGVLLHRDVLRKENFIKLTYDLRQFPNGIYAIEVKENKQVIEKKELDLNGFDYYQVAKND